MPVTDASIARMREAILAAVPFKGINVCDLEDAVGFDDDPDAFRAARDALVAEKVIKRRDVDYFRRKPVGRVTYEVRNALGTLVDVVYRVRRDPVIGGKWWHVVSVFGAERFCTGEDGMVRENGQ